MKVKIVGNILLAIVTACFSSIIICAGIELRVTTMDGSLLSQACVGEPFLIEVSVSDSDVTRTPVIEGLDLFNVYNSGIQIRSVNGRSSVKHIYKIRIDEPGRYTLGPAVLTMDGNRLTSNTIKLTVGEQQQVSQPIKKRQQQNSSSFLMLSLNKKEAFVGEKIKASLRFFYTDDTIQLEQITEPELDTFEKGSKDGPITDDRMIDGIEYHVLEWIFELYPKQAGEFTIPACMSDFLMQSQRDRFSGFSLFFGKPTVRKRVYSNATRITVMPLPPHDPPVEVVGVFSSFNAKIDPPIAKKGEGMVFSLILEGDGNLDIVKVPILQNIPEIFKCYDSKSYCMNDTASGKLAKYFEYIVQGFEDGDWEIPSQHFTYFNTRRKAYETLTTTPLHVAILSSNDPIRLSNVQVNKKLSDLDNEQNKSKEETDHSIYALNKDGVWYNLDSRSMSWWLFFIFVALPLLYLLIYGIKHMRTYMNVRYASLLSRKRAFAIAYKGVKEAAVMHDTKRLYQLFIDLFAARLQIPLTIISQESIEQKLTEVNWTAERLIEWNSFFAALTEQAYSVQKQTEKEKLFDQAFRWLSLLEKVI